MIYLDDIYTSQSCTKSSVFVSFKKTSLGMGISMLKLQLIFLILQQRVSLNKLRHFVSFNTSGRILLAELNYKLGCFSFKFIFIRLKVYNY